MKHIVAFFLVFILNLMPSTVWAYDLASAVQHIESEWARIHYSVIREQQDKEFKHLLSEVTDLQAQYPKQAEFIIQQAIIVASNAENIDAFSALEAIHQAKDLLMQAIELNPKALDGAAFITLGTLYYKVPAWPVAYGDNDKAQQFLEKALTINANAIDANYYYADFLVTQGKKELALNYFNRALTAAVRSTQVFADTQLQAQAKLAINKHRQEERKRDFSLAAN
ncbi:MAG: hypothetical protein RQ733_01210 [Methyloprofundus sp.]|nr:hypothetical protein [Methyloprofundus sp.]MDT8424573.1 hypothetical protein [Methyloprofundus sp.]